MARCIPRRSILGIVFFAAGCGGVATSRADDRSPDGAGAQAPACEVISEPPGTECFCEWLRRGAKFTYELVPCTPGYGKCYWTLDFNGTEVAWVQSHSNLTLTFTCEANRVTTEGGRAGTWDPARRILSFEGAEFAPVQL